MSSATSNEIWINNTTQLHSITLTTYKKIHVDNDGAHPLSSALSQQGFNQNVTDISRMAG